MRILGIETSCDESAVCLIEASGELGDDFSFRVLGNALTSQAKKHSPYGGVFPNLAKNEHQKNLVPLLENVLLQTHLPNQGPTLVETYPSVPNQGPTLVETDPYVRDRASDIPDVRPRRSNVEMVDIAETLVREPVLSPLVETFLATYTKPRIDAIAVTVGPGLEPALWVGINFAKALAHAWGLPIVPVNHMEGHIVISALSSRNESIKSQVSNIKEIQFPMLSLLISGAHTELIFSRKWMHYEYLGRTRDDAVGEAFDKVARMLGSPYPGGPEISRLATDARISGDRISRSALPRPMLRSKDYAFSFAGLKTAVLKLIEVNSPLTNAIRKQIAREFEDAVTEVLVTKTMRAAEEYNIQTLVMGGGVSANKNIRSRLGEACEIADIHLLLPPSEFATDNAIMIALAGYFRASKNEYADQAKLCAIGDLRLP